MNDDTHIDEATLDELIAHLTPGRVERLRRAVDRRLKSLTVVLEGLYDPGNRSAVYRTAEAWGLLNVHVVQPEVARKDTARKVSRGSEKWVRIAEHDGARAAVADLHASGYRVYASDLRAAQPLAALDFSEPVALVFGNEHDGISDEMVDACDGTFIIPMRGLADSFNISVAAGIALAEARRARERAIGAEGDLSRDERDLLFEHYIRLSARWLHRRKSRRYELAGEFPVLEPIPAALDA